MYYKQVDGLAMGSPPAPLLANGWMSKYDKKIKGDAKLYSQYMDDILREIHKDKADKKLTEINKLNSKFLQFTIERENDMSIPFLDMLITRLNTISHLNGIRNLLILH